MFKVLLNASMPSLRKVARLLQPVPLHCDMPDFTDTIKRTGPCFTHGGFADLYEGEWSDGQGKIHKIAIKVLRGMCDDVDCVEAPIRRSYREARVWSKLSHANVTPFYGICFGFEIPSIPSLVAPYYRNGNVGDYLKENTQTDRLQLVTQVAAGLDYLHNMNPPIVHGDIKASNVLVDDNGNARLCDFGLSRVLQTSGFTTGNIAGSCRWMAIELMVPGVDETGNELEPKLTKETDVWAFAMTALEILTGRVPFSEHKVDATVVLSVAHNIRPKRPSLEVVDDRVWFILEACWLPVPSHRPSIRRVALALDLAYTCNAMLDTKAVKQIIYEDYNSFGCSSTPNQVPLNLDSESEGDYPCKWDRCSSTFSSLKECMAHECLVYRLNVWHDSITKAIKSRVARQCKTTNFAFPTYEHFDLTPSFLRNFNRLSP